MDSGEYVHRDQEQKALSLAIAALEKLDEWQGRQRCNASVYEIEDDEFGMMQFYVHSALADIDKAVGNIKWVK